MNIDIAPETERVVREELNSGHFRSVDELILSCVQAWREKHNASGAEANAKLEWLGAAAKEGFDQLDRGDYAAINSDEELEAFLNGIHQEVSAELAAQPTRG